MKKFSVIPLVLCIMLLVAALPCQAYSLNDNFQGDIQPMFTYISLFSTYFDINYYGKATIDVYIFAPYTEETGVSAELQQLVKGQWKTIRSWSCREEGSSCGMGINYYVTEGYAYRVVAKGYVYQNGQVVESTTLESRIRSY